VARGWSLVTGWDLDLEWRGVHWTRWGFRANVNNDWWHGSRVEREEGLCRRVVCCATKTTFINDIIMSKVKLAKPFYAVFDK
jgi:hypothetical protein